ncbi:MAG: bifunctional sulfate adenylyltransferase/adenylylsulfate kinase [Pyrinomonadaceae bacterium]
MGTGQFYYSWMMLAELNNPLIEPFGGDLVDLSIGPEEREQLIDHCSRLNSLQISERSVCDLELLAVGGFTPLDRFMAREDYERSVREMRLANGSIFPIPVTLPIDDDADIRLDTEIALRDARNDLLAVMTVTDIFEWDADEFSALVLGTSDLRHPLNAEKVRWGRRNISGPIRLIDHPKHFDFRPLRLTPTQTRKRLEQIGNSDIVAFQTRNPLHRAHEEMTKRAAESIGGTLFLHPVVGITKPGDVEHYSRVRSYRALYEAGFDEESCLLSLLPLAMRMAGPREALWHMLIRRNYGANHIIIGRDHASPGRDSQGKPFYRADAAQELALEFGPELGMGVIAFDEMVYLPDEDRYEERSKLKPNATTIALSGTEVRENYLNRGRQLPEWFTRPEVSAVLSETYPPRERQGFCIWLTGLSGAGKSTIAEILTVMMLEHGRRVTVLDGDVVRTHLSKGLGFSKADRDTNILRIGFVASEIVRHGGIAVCAAVSPYRNARNEVRSMFGPDRFIEIYVNTPLAECERRDTKGMYAKARRGEITGFTGIDDPYEAPDKPEIEIDTVSASAEQSAQAILDHLIQAGFIKSQVKVPTHV